jgi:hypothetical protein
MDKDIEYLVKLKDAYEKQKKRVLIKLEIDIKKIGTKKVADNLGYSQMFLYKIFNGKTILSHRKLMQIIEQVQKLKDILRME